MLSRALSRWFDRSRNRQGLNLPLYAVLLLPFVGITAGTVGLVAYLSYQSGQQSITGLANQLMDETSDRVTAELKTYLQTPYLINRLNRDAVQQQQVRLEDRDALERLLFQRLQQFESVTAVLFASPEGVFREVDRSPNLSLAVANPDQPATKRVYRLNSQGQREQLLATLSGLNVQRDRPWYKQAVETGKPGWSPIFLHEATGIMTLGASQPVYDSRTNQLLGVFSVYVGLDYVNQFLHDLANRYSGQIIILNQNQEMIATSTLESCFVSDLADRPTPGTATGVASPPPLRQITLKESRNDLTRSLGQYLSRSHLIRQSSNLPASNPHQHFVLNYKGERQFVQIVPFEDGNGLKWQILTVVPASNFTADIYRNMQVTALLSLLALGVAIASGLAITNRLTAYISRLNRASQKLAAGDLSQQLPTDDPIAEIQELAQSFNQMASQLQQSFDRVNTALAESEEKFTSIFRTNPEPMGIAAFETGQILDVNDSMVEFWGYPHEVLVGQNAAELGLWHEAEIYEQFRQQLLQQGKVRNWETAVRFQPGEIKTVLLSADLKELDGEQCIIAVITDITDRKRIEDERRVAEQLLRESEARLRLALEASGTAAWERDLKTDEVLVVPASTTSEPQRYSHQQGMEWVHPDDREPLEQTYREAIDQRGTIQLEHRLWVEGQYRWFQINAKVLTDEANQPVRIMGIALDITDRKAAELETRQLRERLQFLLSNNTAVLFTCKSSGDYGATFVSNNVQMLLGYPPEAFLQDSSFWASHIHPEDAPAVLAGMTSLFEQGHHTHEYRFLHQNGTYRWIRNGLSLIQDTAGTPLEIVGYLVDITDRKQAEQEFQQAKEAAEAANRAKSTFLANMSHELRTPLNVILGYTQLMGFDGTLPTEYQEYLRSIHRSSDHLLSLINDVLDLSKLEVGRLSLEATQFDLPNLLQTLGEMFRLRAEAKQLRLILDYPPDLPQVIIADLNKLRRVIVNLLSNAVRFTEAGTVTLRTRLQKPQDEIQSNPTEPLPAILEVEVLDTGIGIAPAELNVIFEAFSQASAGILLMEGTGLGLTISRNLVQLMGGKLTVSSCPGQGSCFRFQIPVQWLNTHFGLHYQYGEAIQDRIEQMPKQMQPLQPSDLQVMPSDWIAALYKAALNCSLTDVERLIAQIPIDQTRLIQGLQQLSYHYEFEAMMHLSQADLPSGLQQ